LPDDDDHHVPENAGAGVAAAAERITAIATAAKEHAEQLAAETPPERIKRQAAALLATIYGGTWRDARAAGVTVELCDALEIIAPEVA
jgi:hypothetical protein